MGHFGVSVRNHLRTEDKSAFDVSILFTQSHGQLMYHIPCLCHTSDSPLELQYMCAESLKTDWCCLWEKETHMVFIKHNPEILKVIKVVICAAAWPASRRRLPSARVLLVRSLPARSTRHNWLTFTWFLSWKREQNIKCLVSGSTVTIQSTTSQNVRPKGHILRCSSYINENCHQLLTIALFQTHKIFISFFKHKWRFF